MRLTANKLRNLIKEELLEVFSPEKEKKIVKKLVKILEDKGCSVSFPSYSKGLFEVGPSGFRVVVDEIKDGVNRSETGLVAFFPKLESGQGVEQRTLWANNLEELADKFIAQYKEFDDEYDANDEQFEDWIDVQVQQSQGTVQKAMNMDAL